jgi:hypothetical protein
MSTATLNGHRVTRDRVNLPAWGIPWCEVGLDEEATLSGPVKLNMADLVFFGTVMSGGPGPVGRSGFRIAAGAGGWGRTIPAKSYANDAGVKAATVLADAASACGETLDATTLPTTRLGPSWVRDEGPAARTLEQVVPAGWYVRESDGVTVIGKRPTSALTTPVTVAGVDRARRTVVLSAELIAAIVPGAVIEGIEAVDVMHELSPGGGMVTTIWGAGSSNSRKLAVLRRLLEQLDPGRRFRGSYEYRIATQEGERLSLQPVRVSTGMPDLQRVPVRPGIPGAKAEHALGATVVVTFLDASPARPIVTGFADAEGGGFVPTLLELDAEATIRLGAGALLGAARQTDTVIAGPFAGTITGASTKTRVA